MGFDLHGVKPKITGEAPVRIDFDKSSNDEIDAYFDDLKNFESINPGVYFRANVWSWRPLWNYVCGVCSSILSEEDIDGGDWNAGYVIDEDKCESMLLLLNAELSNKLTHRYRDAYMDENKNSSYPFYIEKVEDFVKFLKECGGFSIC